MRKYVDPLVAAIRGENTTVDLPLDVRATAFQKKVWETLRKIPSGETRSYSEVAREIGDPTRFAPSLAPAPRIRWHWPCPVTAWFAATETGRLSLGNRAQEEAAGAGAGDL